MTVFGGLTALLGMLLFQRALGMTLRANPSTKIPYWRNAQVRPLGSTSLRALGAALLVMGAVLLGTTGWYWPFLLVLAGPGAALLSIATHNRRVARNG